MALKSENIEIASLIADECIHKFKKILHVPLFQSGDNKDGTHEVSFTPIAEQLFDIIYFEVKTVLDKDEK